MDAYPAAQAPLRFVIRLVTFSTLGHPSSPIPREPPGPARPARGRDPARWRSGRPGERDEAEDIHERSSVAPASAGALTAPEPRGAAWIVLTSGGSGVAARLDPDAPAAALHGHQPGAGASPPRPRLARGAGAGRTGREPRHRVQHRAHPGADPAPGAERHGCWLLGRFPPPDEVGYRKPEAEIFHVTWNGPACGLDERGAIRSATT
jgi:hypothetical protein